MTMSESSMEQCYRASGILIVSKHRGKLYVLLFRETRLDKESQCNRSYWIDVGGKREPSDIDSWNTARREFLEEAGSSISVCKEGVLSSLWIPEAKYVSHVVVKDFADPAIVGDTRFRWVSTSAAVCCPQKIYGVLIHPRLDKVLKVFFQYDWSSVIKTH